VRLMTCLGAKQHFSSILIVLLQSAHAQQENLRHFPKQSVYFVSTPVTFTRELLHEGPSDSDDPREFDSAQLFFPVNSSHWGEELYIVGWRPVVGKHRCSNGEVVELVHHMNIFAGESTNVDVDKDRIVASYDRGAREYQVPAGYGIPIGSGAPGHKLTMNYHMLLPKCWDFALLPSVVDISGIELILSKKRPLHLAALVAFADVRMVIKPSSSWQVESAMLSNISEIIDCHAAKHGRGKAELVTGFNASRLHEELKIIAVHLHTHAVAVSKWFELRNSTGSLMYRSQEEPAGYGPEKQSLLNLDSIGWPMLQLSNGYQLSQHCKFNAAMLRSEVVFGVSMGTEMCGALLLVGGYSDSGCLPRTFLSCSEGHVQPAP